LGSKKGGANAAGKFFKKNQGQLLITVSELTDSRLG
jgi:hypothetical protein